MPALAQELFAPSVTVAQARRALIEAFRQAGLDSPELDARLLVGHALGLDHTALTIDSARSLGGNAAHALAALATRRLGREPVARIVGVKEFWGLPLRLDNATLVPRPETETVVEAALAAIDSAGLCTLTLTSKGTYTGSLQLAGKRYSYKGKFGGTDSDTNIPRAGNSALTAHFTLDSSGDSDHLTGTISDGNWTASLDARRPVFNAHNPAPFAGSYTVVIPGISGSQTAPQGYGFGTLKVDATGKAKFVGSLADGTAVTTTLTITTTGASAMLSQHGSHSVFALYFTTLGFGSVGFVIIGAFRRRKSAAAPVVLFVLLALLGIIAACARVGTGTSNSNLTPTGPFTVTVKAVAVSGGMQPATPKQELSLTIIVTQ